MRFQIQELRRARADIRSIVGWLAERSPRGARAWLSAYDDMLMRLSIRGPGQAPVQPTELGMSDSNH